MEELNAAEANTKKTTGKKPKTATARQRTSKAKKTTSTRAASSSSSKIQASSKEKVVYKKSTAVEDATVTTAMTMDQRRDLIAQAAYLRAEKRGFNGGDPVEDWLAAEKEVDTKLASEHKTHTVQA